MYRIIVMFPTTSDPLVVEGIVKATAAIFKQCSGFRSITASVDALMGPSARAGEVSRIMEADFATLDDALAALHHDGFQEVRSTTESLEPTLFLYELSDL